MEAEAEADVAVGDELHQSMIVNEERISNDAQVDSSPRRNNTHITHSHISM